MIYPINQSTPYPIKSGKDYFNIVRELKVAILCKSKCHANFIYFGANRNITHNKANAPLFGYLDFKEIGSDLSSRK